MISVQAKLCLTIVLALPSLTWAQPQQTVEGANKFFAQIVEDGHANLVVIVRQLPIIQSVMREKVGFFSSSVVSNKVNDVKVTAQWPGEKISKDACVWHFNGGISSDKFYSTFEFKYEYSDSHIDYFKYTGPEHITTEIDWGKVDVVRDINHWSVARGTWENKDPDGKRIPGATSLKTERGASLKIMAKNSKYGEVLQFRTDNDEMLDRIEYAAKFLQMSCDRTALTGF